MKPMWIAVGVIACCVTLVGFWVFRRGQYYDELFSEESYASFHSGLLRAIAAVREADPDSEPSVDNNTAFVVSPGLAVGVTYSTSSDGGQALHVSMSQTDRPTTHAACSRFGYFAVVMLNKNTARLFPYFTQSGVHHLVFEFDKGVELQVQPLDETMKSYEEDYKPIPFKPMQVMPSGELVEAG